MNNNSQVNKKALFARYALLIPITALVLFPFYWMIITSLKHQTKVFDFPPQLIPDQLIFSNYLEIFEVLSLFPRFYFNSVYIAVLTVVGTCIVASMAGYSFARMKYPFKGVIFILILSSMMIPVEVTTVPMFVWMSKLKLVNTHIPLIVPTIFGYSALSILMMRQHFITIPPDLDEAAVIDGCSPWKIFTRIMLPISKGPLAAVSILAFIHKWNELLEPLIYLNKESLYTLPIGLSLFTDQAGTQWHLVMAASVLITLPVLLVFLFAQKQFIESIALSGIK